MGHGVDSVAREWGPRFGEHLATARRQALLNRPQLAARLGVTEETVRRWERGLVRPSADRLARLIAILSIDAAQFTALPPTAHELPLLARRLRDERARRGIGRDAASGLLGVALSTYTAWEAGRADPSATSVSRVARFLGCADSDVSEMLLHTFTVDTAGWPPFGQVIGERRQAIRMTRDELAGALGVATATIVAWELGHRVPRSQQLRDLAGVIGASVDALEAALPRPAAASVTALGKLVMARQRRLGLRLRDLADRASVDEATLSRWIHGVSRPEPSSLARLAVALEVPGSLVLAVAAQA